MSCCGAKGHLRTSKKGLQHFYHAAKSGPCTWEHESLAHLEIKNEIYQICKTAGWRTDVEYVSEEGDWRADVYAENNNKKIVFEVQLTKIPLNTLKDRDIKYKKAGIESYWILKNKSNYHLSDYQGFEEEFDCIPYLNDYFSTEPGCENPNKFRYYIPKDVIALDINLEKRLAVIPDDEVISLRELINIILDGKFQLKLLKTYEQYQFDCDLRVTAKPILEDVYKSHMKIIFSIKELKRQYAIFKNNKLKNYDIIKENFNICYNSKSVTTKLFFGSVLSPKLGWKWLKSQYSTHIQHVLYLQTYEQIFEIQKLLKEVTLIIDQFEKLIQGLAIEINSNLITEKQKEPKEKVHKSEFPLNSKQDIHQKQNISNSLTSKHNQESNIAALPREIVRFEANLDLSDNWLVDSNGMRYQVILGLPVQMTKQVAEEFEKKGFGRIVQDE